MTHRSSLFRWSGCIGVLIAALLVVYLALVVTPYVLNDVATSPQDPGMVPPFVHPGYDGRQCAPGHRRSACRSHYCAERPAAGGESS